MSISCRMVAAAAMTLLLPHLALAQAPDSASSGGLTDAQKLDETETVVVSLERAAGGGSRDFSESLSADKLLGSFPVRRARLRLDALLSRDSTNVRANTLYARFGVAAVLCTPVRFYGSNPLEEPIPASAADLDKALDRALRREPNNPEIYYWKGTVLAAPIVRAQYPAMTRTSLDFEGAIRASKRAVELAPDSVVYRESLAFELLDMGRMDEAREALRPAQGGQHPMYRLLRDWSHFPHPANSTPTEDAMGDARTIAVRYGLTDWTNARVDAFVFPATAQELEAFYVRLFPGFRFFDIGKQKGDDGMSLRGLTGMLKWSGDSLTAVTSQDEMPAAARGEAVAVSGYEITKPNSDARRRYGVASGRVFCVVTLTNTRGHQPSSPQATEAASGFAGTYEASSGDAQATLEFLDGHSVRLSVVNAGAQPRVLEGEFTVEGDEITVRFPGGPIKEVEGVPWLWHISVKDGVLVALIARDAQHGNRFDFTKK